MSTNSNTTVSVEEYQQIWDKPVIKIGVITMILASVTSFLPIIYLCITLDIYPTVGEFFQSWGMTASTWGALYIVEPITYYTVVGLSGTYVAFLTGNLANMRIPCAAAALEATDVQPGTREGEIVSTLGITGSAITSILFTTIAAAFGVQILTILPAPIVEAFNSYTIPAIFGAVLGQYALKEPKVCIFAIGVALFFVYVLKIPSYIAMFSGVILAIAFARFLYTRKRKSETTAA